MTFYKRINECNMFNEINYFKFYVKNFHVGYIKKKNLNLIKKFPNILKFDNQKVLLDKKFNNFNKRSLAIDKIFKYLVKEKKITSKHREFFPVFHLFKFKPLLKIQRLLGPFFGIQFFGTHINGFVKKKKKFFMWIGKRSKKGNFPNALDQIVAGGLPYEVSVKKNLIKEAYEEANISKSLITNAKYIGTISYRVENKIGLSRYLLFCYDLELPHNFIPKNNDGEVLRFYLWPIDKILKIIKTSRRFKFDCALVIINYALKKKIINSTKLNSLLNINEDTKILKGSKIN